VEEKEEEEFVYNIEYVYTCKHRICMYIHNMQYVCTVTQGYVGWHAEGEEEICKTRNRTRKKGNKTRLKNKPEGKL
jgi:hypothetical protein